MPARQPPGQDAPAEDRALERAFAVHPSAPEPGGLTDGGTTVTITGSDFVTGATADLGGAPLSVGSVTPTQIVGTTAPRTPGDVAVTVHNPGNVSGGGVAGQADAVSLAGNRAPGRICLQDL